MEICLQAGEAMTCAKWAGLSNLVDTIQYFPQINPFLIFYYVSEK